MVCTSLLQSPVFPIRRAASCGGNNTDKFNSNLLSVWRIAWTIPDLQPSLGDCHSVTPGQNEAELSEEPEKADRPLHRCCTALQSCHSVTPGQNEAERSGEPEKTEADRPRKLLQDCCSRCCTALQSCRYCRCCCCDAQKDGKR